MGNIERAIKYIPRLNGQIRVCKGNHDAKTFKKTENYRYFQWVRDDHIQDFIVGDREIQVVMSHYPPTNEMVAANPTAIFLHGHSHHHPNVVRRLRVLDVGIDGPTYNYSPISLETAVALAETPLIQL